MNWLVVGIGDVTLKRVLPALHAEPRCRIHGVVTRNAGKGAGIAPRVWTDLGEALADEAIDAVYVATPVFLHSPQAIASLRAGKHVLCEKPAALRYADAAEMVAVAQQNRRLLGIAYFRRFYPKLRRARELLAAGAIGMPRLAWASCSEWFAGNEGPRPWMLDPRLAGSGPLYDIGSHRVDTMNFMLGRPERVVASFAPGPPVSATEDSATLIVDYAGGARAVVDARWDTRAPVDEFRIIGSEGELDLGPLNGPALRAPGGEESLPSAINRHLPCIANFVDAVSGIAPLACSASDSLPTAWVLDQAIHGGKSHRP